MLQERTKVRATFHLPQELLNEARNTVVALAGPPHRLTLAKLAENALRNEIERLKEERLGRKRGREFPQRTGEVRTGRPIGN
jgi:post-segregation antitoxin (ccd killing protein)